MKVIDCRTGAEMKVDQPIAFGTDEGVTLLELEDWLVAARVKVLSVGPGGFRQVISWWLPVRPFHPAGAGEGRVFLVPT